MKIREYVLTQALRDCVTQLFAMLVCPDKFVVRESWEILYYCASVLKEGGDDNEKNSCTASSSSSNCS